MNTLAKVTLICGSSSRGVINTAKTAQQQADEREQRRDLGRKKRARDPP